MARIWANRLEAGAFTWDDVPANRKDAVKEVLRSDVKNNKITAERYKEITDEEY